MNQGVVGKRIPEVLGGPAYAAIERHVDAALAGERVEFEAELPYAGQGTQVVRCAYDPELDDAGRVVGFVAAIVNITEARRAGAAQRASEERLRSRGQARTAVKHLRELGLIETLKAKDAGVGSEAGGVNFGPNTVFLRVNIEVLDPLVKEVMAK